jgi:hypothetical protein
MSSLRDVQTTFRRALLDQDGDGRLAADILPDGLSASARVAVYRHHVRTTLTEVLVSTFPVVCRLVDRRFFGWLADCYIRNHPPAAPCLFEYGGDLPAFIERFAACAALPWLADVARLEWALNVAFHAPDVVPIGPVRLAVTPPEQLSALVLELDPSVTYIASRWPIDAIWRAHQPGGERISVELDSGSAQLEVRRRDDDVVFRTLSASSFAFRRALADHAPLARAVDAALATGGSFDITGEIRALLDENLVAA